MRVRIQERKSKPGIWSRIEKVTYICAIADADAGAGAGVDADADAIWVRERERDVITALTGNGKVTKVKHLLLKQKVTDERTDGRTDMSDKHNGNKTLRFYWFQYFLLNSSFRYGMGLNDGN